MPRADVIASAMARELEGERKPVADMTSNELSNFLSKRNLSSEAKIAGLKRVEQLKAQEIEDLKLRSALATARSTAGYKALEEERAATEFEQKQDQQDFSNLTIRDIDADGNSIDVKLQGVVGNLPRADKLREHIGKYNDAQAKIDQMLHWAEVRKKPPTWLGMTFQEKNEAKRLATMVQSAMREEVLGAGVVTDTEYIRLKEVIPNPAEFWSAKFVDPVIALKSLKRIARDSFRQKLKGFGVTPAEGSASSVSTAARPSDGPR